MIIVGSVAAATCGSPTAPSTSATGESTPGLTVAVSNGQARLTRWAGGLTVIDYSWCYDIRAPQNDSTLIGAATINRLTFTILGSTGAVYHEGIEDRFSGKRYGLNGDAIGASGCPTWLSDRDLVRATATRYQMRVDYTLDDPDRRASSRSVTVGGDFVSLVPNYPLMTGMTVTHDAKQMTDISRDDVEIGRPATFVASGTGGVPPYQFKWSFNGSVLRDWNPDPTMTWDGTMLGGRPLAAGSFGYFVIQGRSSVGTDVEAGVRIDLNVRWAR